MASSVFAAPFELTDPLFESLNPKEINSAIERSSAQPMGVGGSDYFTLRFFLAESHWFGGRIHQANEIYNQLLIRCESEEANLFPGLKDVAEKSRSAMVCALVEAQLIDRQWPFKKVKLLKRIDRNMRFVNKSKTSITETLYTRGRLRSHLPTGYGQHFGKALLALQSLKRLQPRISSLDFWIGRAYQLHGNEKSAITWFNRALAKNDPRALAFFPNRKYRRVPWHLDGRSYGVKPGLFYSPVQALGASLVVFDDRAFDTQRSFKTSLWATTRGNFGVKNTWVDGEIIKPVQFGVHTKVIQEKEPFYGLGFSAPLSDLTYLKTFRFEGSLSLKRNYLESLYLQLGWAFYYSDLKSIEGSSASAVAASSLPDVSGLFHSGVFGEVGVDTRNSVAFPTRGFRLSVNAYFPIKDLMSESSFIRWRLLSDNYWRINKAHLVSLHGVGQFLNSGPYNQYAKLGGSFPIHGIRQGRYQEKHLVASQFRYHWMIGAFKFTPFLTAATIAPSWNALWNDKIKFGIGASLSFSASRSDSVSFQVGWFNEEVVFQMVAGGRG